MKDLGKMLKMIFFRFTVYQDIIIVDNYVLSQEAKEY